MHNIVIDVTTVITIVTVFHIAIGGFIAIIVTTVVIIIIGVLFVPFTKLSWLSGYIFR